MAGDSTIRFPKIIEKYLNENEEELEDEIISDDEVQGNDPDQNVNFDKNSNLHFAAAFGIIEDVKKELESPNTKIDAENFMGWTPLMMAIRNGHIETVKLLIEKGADITRKNKLGVNCFNLSIANGNIELVETILRHMLNGGISRNRIQENLSPISLAIILKKTHLLRLLIPQGFDLNATTWKTDLTPLMFAAAVRADKVIPMLEAKGANSRAKNYMGVNIQNIMQWRQQGLEMMRAASMLVDKPKINKPLKNKSISTYTEPPATVDNVITSVPIIQVTLPGKNLIPEGNKEVIAHKVVEDAESDILPPAGGNDAQDENDQNKINQMDQTSKPHYVGTSKSNKDKQLFLQPANNDSPIISPPYQYQSPLYYPVNCLNSSFVPSPVTPMMVTSPYQNFIAPIMEMSQNSPIVQNPYQYGHHPPGQPVFFPSPMSFDPNNMVSPNPNSYPMFYAVYPNIQTAYTPPAAADKP